MDLKELREKLNKKHVKVRVPYIQGEAYAVRYAGILKAFTDEVVKNFSNLVKAIFEEIKATTVEDKKITFDKANNYERKIEEWKRKKDIKEIVKEFNENNEVALNSLENIQKIDESVWDDFLEELKKEKTEKDKSALWKEALQALAPQTVRRKKELTDYTLTLSSLFNYYTGRAELLSYNFTDEELSNLYRYIHGKYKSSFPNLTVSGEYYERIMKAVINENLALIKSIPEQILKDMQVVLSQGIISGNQKELVKNLTRIKDVNKDRAVFIARDQIHKAVESFKQVENTALGIEYYEWLTAEDERVSRGTGGHAQNNRRIFKYGSNEAIISYSSQRGFYYGKPGDRPNCRCCAKDNDVQRYKNYIKIYSHSRKGNNRCS